VIDYHLYGVFNSKNNCILYCTVDPKLMCLVVFLSELKINYEIVKCKEIVAYI
jgi:hypothetical protein